MKKEFKLKSVKDFTSHIELGNHFVLNERLPEILDEYKLKTAIITDETVEKLHGKKLDLLDAKVFSFPPGEQSKNRKTKEIVEDHLLAHHFGRDSLIVALGGGVVNDLVGFLASTYYRGIKLVQIPTTLLAMVDASIGGKTAVNTSYGKNLIGSFYPPEKILIDSIFLKTLPDAQMKNGLAEIFKYALIDSPSLFTSMKEHIDLFKNRDLSFMMERIFESVAIKCDIIEQDPFEEMGKRRLLNFGHTIAHALETLEKFSIAHGEAVSIGMRVSCYLSFKLGYLPEETFDEISQVFKNYKMSAQLSKEHSIDGYMTAFAKDKKALKAQPRFVLLQAIGEVHPFDGEYCTSIDFDLINEAINWMHREYVK